MPAATQNVCRDCGADAVRHLGASALIAANQRQHHVNAHRISRLAFLSFAEKPARGERTSTEAALCPYALRASRGSECVLGDLLVPGASTQLARLDGFGLLRTRVPPPAERAPTCEQRAKLLRMA
ncbi:hypothetical protein WS57_19140 [Burkholderia pseudomultivorans]|nr:hypothetical protein WS57_19140 [Burkholderia pseudomultivorans]